MSSSAYTLAEIDAEIARLKQAYQKLNHLSAYNVGGGSSSRGAQARQLKEIEDAIDRWQRRRDALAGGGIRIKHAVPA